MRVFIGQAKERRETEMEERKKLMEKSKSQARLVPVPLYIRMKHEAELQDKLWYEQFSKKEILKHLTQKEFGHSQDTVFEENKRSGRLTFNLQNVDRMALASRGRRTEIVINPKARKLKQDDQLDRIKEQLRSGHEKPGEPVREPLNTSLAPIQFKHSVSERTVMALHLPQRRPDLKASPKEEETPPAT